MSDSRPFVIVGGGLAAAEAAKTLRGDGYDGPLVIIAEEARPPYERPPLTKEYLRGEAGPEKLLPQPASFYDEARIDLRTGTRATAVDLAGRSLALGDGTTIDFERLLLATGARVTRPRLEGVDQPWVHMIRTAEDSDRLRDAAGQARSAVVAGGGWIAAEAAASLRQMGLEVTLVVPCAEVLEQHLGAEAGRELTALHEGKGVRVVRSSRVEAIREIRGSRTVELDRGSPVTGDLVVLGFGVRPATALAEEAGLETGNGILVDEHLRASAPGVFAAGDVAAAWHPRYGERLRTEHWDNARRQGRTAARNMLGGSEAYDRVPYFFSDQFDLGLELIGRPVLATGRLVRHEGPGMIVLWTRDGSVVAGMHTNLWDSRKPIDRLVSSGAVVDPERFGDPSVSLDALASTPA